jgi:hypothetical protein
VAAFFRGTGDDLVAPAFTVHYVPPGLKVALCGYEPKPRLLGLDYLSSWERVAPDVYVTCLECLCHRPPEWQRKRMKGFPNRYGKKTKI